ncbi:4-hydroxy-2-oxoglutarate aldolase, mitochondrial-like [Amphiura filiformis]|uniref:4-hydroxy-2-oxoglutarate aldolase, mitochondrial-like n=1 Tax=Amphiura filiformis TaxID=82378 RepID=UPI003B226F25
MASSVAVFRTLRVSASFASKVVNRKVPASAVLSSNFKLTEKRSMSTNTTGEKSLDLSGIFPPVITPFDDQENIKYDQMGNNMKRFSEIPFRGFVVLGSNGESVYLSKEEKVETVKKMREMAPKDKIILAGSGCESTRDTIEMSTLMAEVGADAVLVITPCFYKGSMTADALFQHFTKVAGASPVPVVLYNVSKFTGVDITAETAIRLSAHPNIIGLKESSGDVAKIGSVVHKTKGNNFQVLAGSASFLLPAYAVGAVGGVCALANVLGNECCDLHKLYHTGKYDEARSLQHRLIAPNAAVTSKFGVPGLKQSMEWFGLYGGPVRSPLLPLTKQQMEDARSAFTGNGFL